MHKKSIVFSLIILSIIIIPAYSLTDNQTALINNISNSSNVSNITFLNIFTEIEARDLAINSSLNSTYYNISNLSQQINNNFTSVIAFVITNDNTNLQAANAHSDGLFVNISNDYTVKISQAEARVNSNITQMQNNLIGQINNISSNATLVLVNQTVTKVLDDFTTEQSARFTRLEKYKADQDWVNESIQNASYIAANDNADLANRFDNALGDVLKREIFFLIVAIAAPIAFIYLSRENFWRKKNVEILRQTLGKLKKEELIDASTTDMSMNEKYQLRQKKLRDLKAIIYLKTNMPIKYKKLLAKRIDEGQIYNEEELHEHMSIVAEEIKNEEELQELEKKESEAKFHDHPLYKPQPEQKPSTLKQVIKKVNNYASKPTAQKPKANPPRTETVPDPEPESPGTESADGNGQ